MNRNVCPSGSAAVGVLLAEGGFQRLGINAIAARAKTDKVLIYRYLDGLDPVLAAYAPSSTTRS